MSSWPSLVPRFISSFHVRESLGMRPGCHFVMFLTLRFLPDFISLPWSLIHGCEIINFGSGLGTRLSCCYIVNHADTFRWKQKTDIWPHRRNIGIPSAQGSCPWTWVYCVPVRKHISLSVQHGRVPTTKWWHQHQGILQYDLTWQPS